MPLIEKEDKREQEPLRIRLQPAIAEQLKAYCMFAESSEAHIVNAALQRLFGADKEFKEFLETNPDAGKPAEDLPAPTPVRVPRRRREPEVSTEGSSSAA